jgi:hypothetical protein
MRFPCRNRGRGAVVSGLLLIALAGSAEANLERRESRQRYRIHAGVEDGSITHPEARRLKREQLKIERAERRFRGNDGQLGARERRRLDRLQDRAGRHIWRSRHNDRVQ